MAVRERVWRGLADSPIWAARPNKAHHALVTLEQQHRLRALITQNVDRPHTAAGNTGEVVLELHGNDQDVTYLTCGTLQPTAEVLDRVRAGEPDPRCLLCRGILKTTATMFGQEFDDAVLDAAQAAVADCDVFLVAGTSLARRPGRLVPSAGGGSGCTHRPCQRRTFLAGRSRRPAHT